MTCTEPTTYGAISRPPLACAAPAGSDAPEFALFEALFGRDSLRVADLLWPRRRDLTWVTVLTLAGLQGVTHNAANEEEPGRIPHEIRPPADAIACEPGAPGAYFGSVDATPMFCLAATRWAVDEPGALDIEVRGRDGEPRTLSDALAAATTWVLARLDCSPMGLLESAPSHEGSLTNQTWKDSHDSHSHEDGRLARIGTTASIEVQALVHDALLAVARLITLVRPARRTALGSLRPERLRAQAWAIGEIVRSQFWVADSEGPFFALGLDRDLDGSPRPLAVRTSNMGHLLDSGVLVHRSARRQRDAVVRALFSPALLSPAGIRTLAVGEIRFWPDSYHNGSCWPWDSYVIARGLHAHGFHGLAWELKHRVWRACALQGCFPEFVSGGDEPASRPNDRVLDCVDRHGRFNRLEQPPQLIQAWTVAAVLAMKAEHGDVVLGRPTRLPLHAEDARCRRLETELLASA